MLVGGEELGDGSVEELSETGHESAATANDGCIAAVFNLKREGWWGGGYRHGCSFGSLFYSVDLWDWPPPLLVAFISSVVGVLAQEKLLYQGVGDSSAGVDEEAGEDDSWSAIAIRIIEVSEG